MTPRRCIAMLLLAAVVLAAGGAVEPARATRRPHPAVCHAPTPGRC